MSKFKIELDLNYESFIFSSNLTNSALTMTIRVEVFWIDFSQKLLSYDLRFSYFIMMVGRKEQEENEE
jgi:hypothetical protein